MHKQPRRYGAVRIVSQSLLIFLKIPQIGTNNQHVGAHNPTLRLLNMGLRAHTAISVVFCGNRRQKTPYQTTTVATPQGQAPL